MAKKYLDDNGLLYFWQKIKTLLGGKVDKDGSKVLSDVNFTSTLKDKLDGIASGAEVNVQADWNETNSGADSYIKNKPTIPAGSVVDSAMSSTSENPVQNKVIYTELSGKVNTSSVGAASGVCPLNSSSKIDTTYLPSYVDDVVEAYPVSGATELAAGWLSATSGGSALTPETGKIYVLMDASTSYAANSQFRWGGSAYVKLADGGVTEITNAEIDTIMAT